MPPSREGGGDVPRRVDVKVAIVGGGLAGFTAYLTLRHFGVPAHEVCVFSDERDPSGPFARRAEAIRQQAMRSESDGHCFPRSFPGLAVREAVRRGTIWPLLGTATNSYRPSLEWFLAHVAELRERSAWDDVVVDQRVERIRAVEGGFLVDARGPFAHVLVAPGHPGRAMPPELAGDHRVVHAYEPHDYAGEVAIVGAGMAAATEWVNALQAGATVTSVRRREPLRQPLNVERPLFTKRGLKAFHATTPARRAELLRELSAPSYPRGPAWDEPIDWAARHGRFRVEEHVNGAEQVICATGFLRGFEHDPLLARLVDDHELETVDRWIVLGDDSTVLSLTDEGRTLALAGSPAQWAYPAADTLVGMKWVARRFAERAACHTR